MRISLLYASWINYGEKWNSPLGFEQELRLRGHEVKHFNLYHRDGAIRQYSNEGLNQLHADIRNGYQPDVIMLFDYGVFDAAQLDRSTYKDAIWIMESGDDYQAFSRNSQKAHKFDIVVTPDYRCMEVYRANNINAYWWNHCCDTNIYFPESEIQPIYNVVTTSGPRGKGLTEKLSEVFGEQFNNQRFFYGRDHAQRLQLGKLVFQCSQFGEISRRIFEGIGCKRAVITDRLSPIRHLEDLFKDGEDIILYSTFDECIEKIKYYSEHDSERERIALNGYNKVISEHSVSVRVDQLEDYIEEFKVKRD